MPFSGSAAPAPRAVGRRATRTRRIIGALVVAVGMAVLTVGGSSLPADAKLPFLAEESGLPTLAPLLEQVTPAVVNIAVLSRSPAQENPLMRDPFFRRFFNMPPILPEGRPRMSAGSGVIVDARRGYVLTNNHVIANATEVMVTLKDRRRFKAEVVGSDPATDVALLKVEADRLTALTFGDSDRLQVGDYVLAIGNPFGLGQTVTSGIVSALGRSGLNIEGYEDFIQTDASINPGNSGGALINLRGELVGINTAIIAPAGGNVGIGFAVPSNMAKSVMDQLIRYGEIRRGRIGVSIQDVTPEIAEALELERGIGAIVSGVEPGSPADRAGLRAGDLILEVDGRQVETAADVRNRIGLVPVGERVVVVVQRDGRKSTINVQVGEPAAVTSAEPGRRLARLPGATLQDLRPGTPGHGRTEGVLVAAVEDGSLAWRAGLREGDVIVAVNRTKVTSVREVEAILERGPRAIALNVVRGNMSLFIVIQ